MPGTVKRSDCLHDAYKTRSFRKQNFLFGTVLAVNAEAMARRIPVRVWQVADDLADCGPWRSGHNVSCATMSTATCWSRALGCKPGQHIDLIGAYRPDMREVDDAALLRSRVFVDSFDTTVGHIGEMKIPLESGAFDHARSSVGGLLRSARSFQRARQLTITLFKNGGGAHLDLMTSRYILDRWQGTAAMMWFASDPLHRNVLRFRWRMRMDARKPV